MYKENANRRSMADQQIDQNILSFPYRSYKIACQNIDEAMSAGGFHIDKYGPPFEETLKKNKETLTSHTWDKIVRITSNFKVLKEDWQKFKFNSNPDTGKWNSYIILSLKNSISSEIDALKRKLGAFLQTFHISDADLGRRLRSDFKDFGSVLDTVKQQIDCINDSCLARDSQLISKLLQKRSTAFQVALAKTQDLFKKGKKIEADICVLYCYAQREYLITESDLNDYIESLLKDLEVFTGKKIATIKLSDNQSEFSMIDYINQHTKENSRVIIMCSSSLQSKFSKFNGNFDKSQKCFGILLRQDKKILHDLANGIRSSGGSCYGMPENGDDIELGDNIDLNSSIVYNAAKFINDSENIVSQTTLANTWRPAITLKVIALNCNIAIEDHSFFSGRGDELAKIKEILSRSESSHSLIRMCFICGIGGIGKTSLARKYALERYKEKEYCCIFWVDASGKSAYKDSFINAKTQLKLDLIDTSPKSVHAYLLKKYQRVLCILDNFDGDTDGSEYCDLLSALKDDFPTFSNYSSGEYAYDVLVTSRCTSTKLYDDRAVSLSYFSKQDAQEYIANLCDHLSHDSTVLSKATVEEKNSLADMLMRYPLAIKQAVHFIQACKTISLSDYMNMHEAGLKRGEYELLNPKNNYEEYPKTLWTVLDFTIDQILSCTNGLKILILLCHFSYFSQHPLPITLLMKKFTSTELKRFGFDDLESLRDAIKSLEQYCILEPVQIIENHYNINILGEYSDYVVSINPTFQEIIRAKLRNCQWVSNKLKNFKDIGAVDDGRYFLMNVFEVLQSICAMHPYNPNSWSTGPYLQPHSAHIAQQLFDDRAKFFASGVGNVTKLANFLKRIGDYEYFIQRNIETAKVTYEKMSICVEYLSNFLGNLSIEYSLRNILIEEGGDTQSHNNLSTIEMDRFKGFIRSLSCYLMLIKIYKLKGLSLVSHKKSGDSWVRRASNISRKGIRLYDKFNGNLSQRDKMNAECMAIHIIFEHIDLCIRLNEYQEAFFYFQKIRYENMPHPYYEAMKLIIASRCSFIKDQFQDAINHADRSIAILRELRYKNVLAVQEAYLDKGKAKYFNGQFEVAIKCFERIISSENVPVNIKVEAYIYCVLSNICNAFYVKAEDYFYTLIKLSKNLPDHFQLQIRLLRIYARQLIPSMDIMSSEELNLCLVEII